MKQKQPQQQQQPQPLKHKNKNNINVTTIIALTITTTATIVKNNIIYNSSSKRYNHNRNQSNNSDCKKNTIAKTVSFTFNSLKHQHCQHRKQHLRRQEIFKKIMQQ
jgi:hypothetical protein